MQKRGHDEFAAKNIPFASADSGTVLLALVLSIPLVFFGSLYRHDTNYIRLSQVQKAIVGYAHDHSKLPNMESQMAFERDVIPRYLASSAFLRSAYTGKAFSLNRGLSHRKTGEMRANEVLAFDTLRASESEGTHIRIQWDGTMTTKKVKLAPSGDLAFPW